MHLDQFISYCDILTFNVITPITILFVFFGLDDFMLDVLGWFLGAKPTQLTQEELRAMRELPEKRIAVMVAAWKEDGVLKQMVRGNLAAIQYENYSIFLGVYPNDEPTLKEAQELASRHLNVQVIVNPLNGPTCKGQMLNVMVRGILQREVEEGIPYDAFMIHDSEDLIHKEEFKLVNRDLEKNDFIQTPVFSLPVSPLSMVAGVYIDEFAEAHTKYVLIRNKLGVAIPSAGVGTALSRRLVLACLQEQGGNLMNTNSLTEDYELGLSTQRFGFTSQFSCSYSLLPNGEKDFIATREYFPKAFQASVRQKSRWTLGIAFQGFENLGWAGGFLHRYFLFRDRKGPFCNALVAFTFIVFFYSEYRDFDEPGFIFRLFGNGILLIIVQVNLFLMVNRVIQRMTSVYALYGWGLCILAPIRWPLANLINFLATYKAICQYLSGKLTGKQPQWIKTDHELPAGFGSPADLSLDDL